MKLALIYGGQGSQVQKMGLDFYENNEKAKSFYNNLPFSDLIKEISFNMDQKSLNETKNAQLALVSFEIMVSELIKSKGIRADGFCGLSIGEYPALYGAGVISSEDAIKIAKFRGEAMDIDSKKNKTKMLAIINSTEDYIKNKLEDLNEKDKFVEISNINSNRQIVVGGDVEKIEILKDILKKEKIKAIPLRTEAAFHTSYMKDASKKLGLFLKDIDFKDPKLDLYLNITGEKYKGEDIKDLMTRQVKESVRLYENIKNMINNGYKIFIEISPSPVVGKIIKKIDSSTLVYQISNLEDYKMLVENFNGK